MAKSSISTGEEAAPVHTRTTAGPEDSQVVVIGNDGSDSVLDFTTLATAAKQDTLYSLLDGAVNASMVDVNITAVTAQAAGCSRYRTLDLDESEEEVKATAGIVYGMWVTNQATATRWIKFYNATAANVTVGSTTPVLTIGIPGNTSDDVSGAFQVGGPGVAFSTAITFAATTGVADADTGAPAANDVIVNLFYD